MGIEAADGANSSERLNRLSREVRSLDPGLQETKNIQKVENNEQHIQEDEFDYDVSDLQREQLEEHVEHLNEIVRTYTEKFNFELHRDTDRYYVEVIDAVENEIIREIPPEQVLDLVARIEEMIGLIADERV